MGGLGNQLFQIAAGLRYTNQAGGKLILDDSFGNFRKNSLGKADVFSFNSKFFLPIIIGLIFGVKIGSVDILKNIFDL
jgi:hypothetical protein